MVALHGTILNSPSQAPGQGVMKAGMAENKTQVTVIGGGFAGLAAAVALERAGVRLELVEKRPFFGGRAYSFREPQTGSRVDNGQHLLMGAYHETFTFLRRLGTLDLLDFQPSLEVSFAHSAEKMDTLRCPNWPAPLHLGWGLMRYRGLGWKDKWRMNRILQLAKQTRDNGKSWDEKSVLQLMQHTGQTPRAVKGFWEPLGLATLNEPLDLASAELFMEVLRQGLLKTKNDSRLVFPKVGFSELYAEPAEEYFRERDIPLHFQSQIEGIVKEGQHWILHIRGGTALRSEKILFAVPPNALLRILENSDGELEPLKENLDQFKSSPIISINLWFKNFNPPHAFLGMIDSPLHWMFNKAKIFGGERTPYVSLVVSGAYDLAQKNKRQLVELAVAELRRFYPEVQNQEPLHSQVIKENEATFSGRLGLQVHRPPARTSVPGIYLAGDWTQTSLPATIESAVTSGHLAAKAILEPNS